MESFLLAFIPLFVAIDPLGIFPLFLSMTQGFSFSEKKKLALQAVLTAFVIGLAFAMAGHVIFRVLGITASDFRIGGGLLLLILSIRDMAGMSAKTSEENTPPDKLIGNVPIGIPIIAGPAMLTTLLILHDEHPLFTIASALVANLLIVLILFFYSERIVKLIGESTSKVIAKVVAIFLAAIGVMMIRRGVETFIAR